MKTETNKMCSGFLRKFIIIKLAIIKYGIPVKKLIFILKNLIVAHGKILGLIYTKNCTRKLANNNKKCIYKIKSKINFLELSQKFTSLDIFLINIVSISQTLEFYYARISAF